MSLGPLVRLPAPGSHAASAQTNPAMTMYGHSGHVHPIMTPSPWVLLAALMCVWGSLCNAWAPHRAITMSIDRRGGLPGGWSRRDALLSSISCLPLMYIPRPDPAAASEPATSPVPVFTDGRLTGIDAYAVTTAEGVPVVTVGLDYKGRVRTVASFFASRSDAEYACTLARRASPSVAGNATVTPVPLNEALGLAAQGPYKIQGLPGYFCHRFYVPSAVRDEALRLTGLASLSDTALPLFYSPAGTGRGQSGSSVELYFTPEGAQKKGGGYAEAVAVTDLMAVAREWERETKQGTRAPGGGGGGSEGSISRAMLLPPGDAGTSVGAGAGAGEVDVEGARRPWPWRGKREGKRQPAQYSNSAWALALELDLVF